MEENIKLSNGSLERSVVEYYCDRDYYFNDEFVNATYECNLGASWYPEKPPICIKGCQNLYFTQLFDQKYCIRLQTLIQSKELNQKVVNIYGC